jgi:hypothetical protein
LEAKGSDSTPTTDSEKILAEIRSPSPPPSWFWNKKREGLNIVVRQNSCSSICQELKFVFKVLLSEC